MTREELAAELYHLVVTRCRRKGRYVNDRGFYGLAGWSQELWCQAADSFADEYNLCLEDS